MNECMIILHSNNWNFMEGMFFYKIKVYITLKKYSPGEIPLL